MRHFSLIRVVIIHIKGVLSCLDGFMNIALEETQEFVAGVPSNRYGDAFIRGNNGKNISNASVSKMHLSLLCLVALSQSTIHHCKHVECKGLLLSSTYQPSLSALRISSILTQYASSEGQSH